MSYFIESLGFTETSGSCFPYSRSENLAWGINPLNWILYLLIWFGRPENSLRPGHTVR